MSTDEIMNAKNILSGASLGMDFEATGALAVLVQALDKAGARIAELEGAAMLACHGFMSDAERVKVQIRINKWLTKNGVHAVRRLT